MSNEHLSASDKGKQSLQKELNHAKVRAYLFCTSLCRKVSLSYITIALFSQANIGLKIRCSGSNDTTFDAEVETSVISI